MAEDLQGLMVLTEGDRFVTIGRAGRARVWRVDLTGEALEDVDRTGVAAEVAPHWKVRQEDGQGQQLLAPTGDVVCPDHRAVHHRDGKPPWCDRCFRANSGRTRGELPGIGGRRDG